MTDTQSYPQRRQRKKTTASRKKNKQRSQAKQTQSSPLEKSFLQELADILDAEKQLVQALPPMAEAAQSDQLRNTIKQHLAETQEQVKRAQQVFQLFHKKPKTTPCAGMKVSSPKGKSH
jgi:ferritin-like metal-binding protein YciE